MSEETAHQCNWFMWDGSGYNRRCPVMVSHDGGTHFEMHRRYEDRYVKAEHLPPACA